MSTMKPTLAAALAAAAYGAAGANGRGQDPGTPMLPLIGPVGGIGPIRTDASIAVMEVPGKGRAVCLQLSTPSGVAFYFLHPTDAKSVGEALIENARVAESGIVVAPG